MLYIELCSLFSFSVLRDKLQKIKRSKQGPFTPFFVQVVNYCLAKSISISTNVIYGGMAMVFKPQFNPTNQKFRSIWNSTIPR